MTGLTNPDRKGGDLARRARRGSGILEVALVLPVLMITLMAIADLGRYVYATNMMP